MWATPRVPQGTQFHVAAELQEDSLVGGPNAIDCLALVQSRSGMRAAQILGMQVDVFQDESQVRTSQSSGPGSAELRPNLVTFGRVRAKIGCWDWPEFDRNAFRKLAGEELHTRSFC